MFMAEDLRLSPNSSFHHDGCAGRIVGRESHGGADKAGRWAPVRKMSFLALPPSTRRFGTGESPETEPGTIKLPRASRSTRLPAPSRARIAQTRRRNCKNRPPGALYTMSRRASQHSCCSTGQGRRWPAELASFVLQATAGGRTLPRAPHLVARCQAGRRRESVARLVFWCQRWFEIPQNHWFEIPQLRCSVRPVAPQP